MRCVECNVPIAVPALVVAMEQRDHFALKRHTELCTNCALKVWTILEREGAESRHWRQSINCGYCGGKLPIARLRFDIPDRVHKHMAICEPCYNKMRDALLRNVSNLVSFIEKEWQAPGHTTTHRTAWPIGAQVQVKPSDKRFGGQIGTIRRFRCLVQPWFGYDVLLESGVQHFFHERDLNLITPLSPAPAPSQPSDAHPKASGPAPSDGCDFSPPRPKEPSQPA